MNYMTEIIRNYIPDFIQVEKICRDDTCFICRINAELKAICSVLILCNYISIRILVLVKTFRSIIIFQIHFFFKKNKFANRKYTIRKNIFGFILNVRQTYETHLQVYSNLDCHTCVSQNKSKYDTLRFITAVYRLVRHNCLCLVKDLGLKLSSRDQISLLKKKKGD